MQTVNPTTTQTIARRTVSNPVRITVRNLSTPCLFIGLFAVAHPANAAFIPVKTGAQVRYHLSYQGEGSVNIKGLFADANKNSKDNNSPDSIQTRVSADLEIVQVDASTLSVRLIGASHQMVINGQPRDLTREMHTLAHSCFLKVDAQGRVNAISFEAATPVVARSLMRSIVSALEFVRPASAGSAWQCSQDSVNGLALAGYRTTHGSSVEKRIVDYPHQREIGPKGVPHMHPVTQGALRFDFRNGDLLQVNGTLTTGFSLASKGMSEGHELFKLNRIKSDFVPAAKLAELRMDYKKQCSQEAPTALHVHDVDPTSERASWVNQLHGATLESIETDLIATDASGARNDSALYSKLYALMTLHPETTGVFERRLDSADPTKLSTRLIVAAMAAAASGSRDKAAFNPIAMRTAEAALRRTLASHRDRTDMVLLLTPAIGMTTTDDLETERLLESQTESKDRDIAISCALTLGSLAHGGSPERSQRVVGFLVHKLAVAPTWFQMPLMSALGNTGSADCLNTLAAYAKRPAPQERSAALVNLRLIEGDRATHLLYAGLHDTDPDVRQNAAQAFEFRPFSAADVAAFTKLAAGEKVDAVRKVLLENLNLEMPYHPETHAILAQAAKADSSEDIRRTVNGWLK